MKKLLLPITLLLFIAISCIGFANTVTLYPTDDAYVDLANPTTNYGSLGEILSTGSGIDAYRGYFKYNISSCTGINSSDITEATAYFYVIYGTSSLSQFKKLSTSGYGWNESTINYNNRPPTLTSIGDFYNDGDDGTEHSINITSFVQSEVTSGYDAITFDWEGSTTSADRFYSKEALNPLFKPRLVINYNGTLSCNTTGSGNSTTIQEVHVPSYVRPYSNLPCYVMDSVNEMVSWKIYKKEPADVGFNLSYLGTGMTSAGKWAIVGTANASIVSPDSLFYCQVSNEYMVQVSNNANATQIFNITLLTSLSDVSLYENQRQTIVFSNVGSNGTYALAKCDFLSPSNTHFYPNSTYGYPNCVYVNSGSSYALPVEENMTESGYWSRKSCTIYASLYDDCRNQDLGEQDYSLNETSWFVSGIPTIEDIYIIPESPLTNQSVTCFSKAISGDNRTIIGEVWIQFTVDENGNLGATKFTNVTNGTYVNASYNIKDYAIEGSNVSCVSYSLQRSPVYVGGNASYSNNVTAIVLTGTEEGRWFGDLFGVSGAIGNMMLAIVIIVSAIVFVCLILAKLGVGGDAIGIIVIAILLAGIIIFTFAGWLPWILLALVIIVVALMGLSLIKKSGLTGGT